MPYIDRDTFIKQQRDLYCKDCARRMGVKNGKFKELYKIGEAPCRSCELNDVLDHLDDYPEADVAPVVHAHWVYKYKGTSHDDIAYCSRCEFYVEDKINNVGIFFNFCPNCGAKMDEEVKEDGTL